MKFHCPTKSDRYIAKAKRLWVRVLRRRKWKLKFAWLPTRMTTAVRDCRWFEFYWERNNNADLGYWGPSTACWGLRYQACTLTIYLDRYTHYKPDSDHGLTEHRQRRPNNKRWYRSVMSDRDREVMMARAGARKQADGSWQ